MFPFILFLTFFYLYTPELILLPVSIRVLLGLAGGIHFFAVYSTKFQKKIFDIQLDRNFIRLIAVFIIIVCVALFFCVINQSADYKFAVDLLIRVLFLISAAYIICVAYQKFVGKIDEFTGLKLIIYATTIQSVIACLMFLSPSVKEIFNSISRTTDNSLMQALLSQGIGSYRIIGFGSSLFGAGLEVSFALFSIIALVKGKSRSNYELIFLMLLYLINASVGLLMARTTFIGIAFSLVYLVFPYGLSKSSMQFSIYLFSFLILMGTVIYSYVVNSVNSGIFYFAFEALINFKSGSGFTTESSEDLKTMYIWPTELKTYLLGEGYMNDPLVPGMYYMGIDVGYIRLLFFGGIIFLLLWFVMHYYILNYAYKNMGKPNWFKLYAIFLFVFLAVANFKGLSDYLVQFIFIYMFTLFIGKRQQTEKELVI